ncbi:hypothetical protein [Nostoc sp.]|uniref:hypothetical protein n=1 Tax=Nostoc sp. TaxID=1180 RepID=UPI002FFA8AA0
MKKYFANSIINYTQAVSLNPNDAVYNNRGDTHSTLGGKQRAIADLQKVANLYQGKEIQVFIKNQ